MNIFAYTAPTCPYPEYVSVNERDGGVEITVRGPGHNGTQVGACIVPDSELRKLALALIRRESPGAALAAQAALESWGAED